MLKFFFVKGKIFVPDSVISYMYALAKRQVRRLQIEKV